MARMGSRQLHELWIVLSETILPYQRMHTHLRQLLLGEFHRCFDVLQILVSKSHPSSSMLHDPRAAPTSRYTASLMAFKVIPREREYSRTSNLLEGRVETMVAGERNAAVARCALTQLVHVSRHDKRSTSAQSCSRKLSFVQYERRLTRV